MKVIIIGGGQVGAYIANLLLANKCEVTVLENRADVLSKLKNDLPENVIMAGSGTDPKHLEAAGIGDADVVVAVTGVDETNLVASTLAKMEFGVPRVIARVNNPKNAWLFNSGMGVDVGVNQADLMAHLVVTEMDLTNMMTIMKLNDGNYSIVQIGIDAKSPAISKAVKDLAIPQNALLITISRGQETIVPNGDTVIRVGDSIVALTNEENRTRLYKLFGQVARG
jgi:trk system potassium uptake protein TrkA